MLLLSAVGTIYINVNASNIHSGSMILKQKFFCVSMKLVYSYISILAVFVYGRPAAGRLDDVKLW